MKGKYIARLESRTLILLRRGAEAASLQLDDSAVHLGKNRIRLGEDRRAVVFSVNSVSHYTDRLAADLVSLGRKKYGNLNLAEYQVSRTLIGLAFLPAGIAAVGLLGGAIGGAIGGASFAGLLKANLAIIRREAWPAWLRASLALGTSLAAYGVLALGMLWLLPRSTERANSRPPESTAAVGAPHTGTTGPRKVAIETSLGQVEDPDGDCRIVVVDDRQASIEVPGTIHELRWSREEE